LWGATAEAGLITLLIFGLIVGSTLAAKGGGGKPGGGSTTGSGTISLAPLVYDANGNGLPNHGDTVTFDISTTASTPYVLLECYQSGALVLSGRKGYFEGSLDTNRNFGLASGVWQGGAAECTASIATQTKRGWSRHASTSFYVDG
jgi:hypothetical protein